MSLSIKTDGNVGRERQLKNFTIAVIFSCGVSLPVHKLKEFVFTERNFTDFTHRHNVCLQVFGSTTEYSKKAV